MSGEPLEVDSTLRKGSSPAGAERFHALDAARAAAMMLGLFFHGAHAYTQFRLPWPVHDSSRHVAMDLFVWFSRSFRMPVFFLMSGFFARLLYLKLGMSGFVRNRIRRLLVPFLIALVPLQLTSYFLRQWAARWSGDAVTFQFSTGHLWFLYYLLLLLAALLIAVALFRGRGDTLLRSLDAVLRRALRSNTLPFVIAVPVAFILSRMDTLGVEHTTRFAPQVRVLAFYGVFVGLGWLLHRQAELVEELGRRFRAPLWVAVLTALPLLILQQRHHAGSLGRGLRLAALYLAALFTASMVLLFLGLFVRYAARSRPWVSYLADSSYWSYLIHLPVVITAHIIVAQTRWPVFFKYAVVMSLTLAVCLTSYHFLVRYTFIGMTLNGRRTSP